VLLALFFLSLRISVAASLDYEYPDFKPLIGANATLHNSFTKEPFIGITSHHLPTAAPMLNNFFSLLKKKRKNIKTFVVIGPDHSERCRQKFVSTNSDIGTMYGKLKLDKELSQKILASGVKIENNCFVGEHSIGVEVSYIKKYYPEAKVVPILLAYSAKNFEYRPFINILKKNQKDIFVLESTDFSHYVNVRQSNIRDAVSERLIKRGDRDGFTLKLIDSPATIKIILELADVLNLKPEIIEHKNSFDYTGLYNNTTSYFSVFF